MRCCRRNAALLPLLIVVLVAPARSAEDDSAESFRAEYELVAESIRGDETVKAELKAKLFCIPAEDGERYLVSLLEGGDQRTPDYFPLGALAIDSKGELRVELERSDSREIISKFLSSLVGLRVPADRLQAPKEGAEKVEFFTTTAYKQVPVQYKSSPVEGAPNRLNYHVRLAGEPTRTLGTAVVVLKSLDFNYVFQQGEPMPIGGTWVQLEERTGASKTERRMKFTRTAFVPLKAEETKQITTEFESLMRVIEGIDSSELKDLQAAETKLRDFQAKTKDGVLVSAIPGIQKALSRKKLQIQKIADPRAEMEKLRGRTAPDFTLEDLAGNKVTLSAQKGNVVLLSFWGVGCKGCRQEAPHLTRLTKQYQDAAVRIYAINAYNEPKEEIEKFTKPSALTHTILLYGNSIAWEQYCVDDYPANFIIDKEGKIVWFHVGFDGESTIRMIEEQLAKHL